MINIRMRRIISSIGQRIQKRMELVKSQPVTNYPANTSLKPANFGFLWLAVAIIAQICIFIGYPILLPALRNFLDFPILYFLFKYGLIILGVSVIVASLLVSIERAFVDRQGTRAIIGFGVWLFLFINLLIAMFASALPAG